MRWHDAREPQDQLVDPEARTTRLVEAPISWPHDPECGSESGEIGEKRTSFGNNEVSTTQCHDMRRTSESLPPNATDSFLSVESLFAPSWLLD